MKKMKINIAILLLFFASCLFSFYSNVFANADSSSDYSGGAAKGTCNNTFCVGGASDGLSETTYEEGKYGTAFKIQLVYYSGSGNYWDILGEAVVYNGDNQKIINRLNTRLEKKITVGTGAEFANQLHKLIYENYSDDDITKWFDSNNSENFKALAEQMGVDKSKLSKKSTKVRALNSAAYRVIAQKLVAFNGGFQTRKEMARWYGEDYGYQCYAGLWNVTVGSCVGAFYDLYTVHDDIGIIAPSREYHDWSWTYYGFDRLSRAIENTDEGYASGSGYGIYEFENPYENKYDYSIDAACTDCDSTNKNGTYLIQDTNDWEAIFASTKSEVDDEEARNHIKDYYKKNVKSDSSCNVYCREEYKVVYPNANNYNGKDKEGKSIMYIEPGRYFTVNQKSSGSMYKAGIFNFAPIKIEKTRECRALGDSNHQEACLNAFAKENENEKSNKVAAGESGTIQLTYNEKIYKITDKDNIYLEDDKERTIDNYSVTYNKYEYSDEYSSDYILTAKSTKYYVLPDDVYRYVEISSGESIKRKPSENTIEHFYKTDVANLPVSYENYNTDNTEITLKYSLPTNDSNSMMNQAFNKNNDYFGSRENNWFNIYNEESEKGYDSLENYEKELIKSSACSKMYGHGSKAYNSCRNDRKANKSGECWTNINEKKYTCKLKTCSEDGCDNPKCAIVGDKYYDDTGTETTKEDYEKKCPECRIDGNKYYGKNGTEISKEEYYAECPLTCRIVISENKDVYYYDATGASVSYDVYKKTCDDTCSSCNGGICCPDTDMVCPDENGNCPSRGGRKIIYRTIDLDNPFPYIDGDGRKTGANWCSYNIYTKKTTCKNNTDNPIVSKYIINNRGIASKAIYTLDIKGNNNSLYTVTLNSETIKNIKNYNKSHEYDDNSLTCDKKGTCRSDFLKILREKNIVTINES